MRNKLESSGRGVGKKELQEGPAPESPEEKEISERKRRLKEAQ